MDNKHWLILYDIREEKRLVKVASLIESYGYRVQKSVFEADAPEYVIKELIKRIESIIDIETDFVLFFEVCERDWQKKEVFGKDKDLQNNDANFIIL